MTAAVQQGRGRHDVVLGVGGTAFAAVEVADRWGVPAVLRVGEAEPLPVVADWLAMPWSPPIELRARRAFALADTVVANSAAAVRTYRSQGWVANYVSFSDGVELAAIDERVGRSPGGTPRSRLGIGTSATAGADPGDAVADQGPGAPGRRAGADRRRTPSGAAGLHRAAGPGHRQGVGTSRCTGWATRSGSGPFKGSTGRVVPRGRRGRRRVGERVPACRGSGGDGRSRSRPGVDAVGDLRRCVGRGRDALVERAVGRGRAGGSARGGRAARRP